MDVCEPEAGARLTIDLSAIVANWKSLAARAPQAECAAAVKADAYGTGLETTVHALDQAGCRTFFVAHLAEARRARALAPRAAIYVLNGLIKETENVYAALDLRPVLGSLEEIQDWSAFVEASGWSGPAALHVDTGMNRLGLSLEQARSVAQGRLPPLSLVMSHLACADEPEHPLNARQITAFHQVRAIFKDVPASLSNSSGLFLPDNLGFDLVRPGIALYGGNPTPGRTNPMRAVATLEARVIDIRTVEAGASVGYGAIWTAPKRSRIALLSIGYADGYLRAGSNRAEVAIHGRRCPVVGRISMDLIAVDVTDVSGPLMRGDFIEIIGQTIGIDEVAAKAGTISYEVLTRLGERFHRSFIRHENP